MKIAIVYDWMDKMGGVERMLLVLHEMYPDADWYTSFVDIGTAHWIRDQVPEAKLKTSFMQGLPSFIKKSRILSLPFFPCAFESFDLSSYDVVISVTSSFAKGVITQPHTKHICILLTPTRWLYSQHKNYQLGMRNEKFLNGFTSWLLRLITQWDQVASSRPDEIIAISEHVAELCRTYYHRDSTVIYPPFDSGYWQSLASSKTIISFDLPNKYFLVVSRLEPYKRVDLAIDALQGMKDIHLVIVGKGTQRDALRSRAGAQVLFLEDLSDAELAYVYQRAEALVMPQEEDFGYVALEAQACACPVIAYVGGGASETIIDTKTGRLFHAQTVEALQEAVADFQRDTYNLMETNERMKWSKQMFVKKIQGTLTGSLSDT